MRKTFGLLALTVGIAAAGCAALPHTAVQPMSNATRVGESLPGVVRFTNLHGGYGTQGLTVTTAAKQIEVIVFNSNGDVATNSLGQTLAASYSIASTTATASIPGMPAGNYYVQFNVYKDKAVHNTAGVRNGTDALDALLYQTEATVSAIVGVPVNATLKLYPTASANKVVDASASTTTQFSLSGVTGDFLYRFADWSPSKRMSSPTGMVRISLNNTTAFNTTTVGNATGSVYFMLSSSTGSTQIASASGGTWQFAPDNKTIYTDVDFTTIDSSFGSHFGDTATSSAFSFFLPKALTGTNTNLYITDIGSGSSNPTGI